MSTRRHLYRLPVSFYYADVRIHSKVHQFPVLFIRPWSVIYYPDECENTFFFCPLDKIIFENNLKQIIVKDIQQITFTTFLNIYKTNVVAKETSISSRTTTTADYWQLHVYGRYYYPFRVTQTAIHKFNLTTDFVTDIGVPVVH